MEYKGYDVITSKKGNVVIKKDNYNSIVLLHDKHKLNEKELKAIVDKTLENK